MLLVEGGDPTDIRYSSRAIKIQGTTKTFSPFTSRGWVGVKSDTNRDTAMSRCFTAEEDVLDAHHKQGTVLCDLLKGVFMDESTECNLCLATDLQSVTKVFELQIKYVVRIVTTEFQGVNEVA
jgi:hypothetical protein